MSEENTKPTGPDFAKGIPTADLADGGMILGQVAGEAVLLARAGGARFAIGAECTHYHGPLAEGVLVADTVRCPWHRACFSLRSGEALRAPALNPSSIAGRSMSAKSSSPRGGRRGQPRSRGRSRSSSSAVVPREMPQQRC